MPVFSNLIRKDFCSYKKNRSAISIFVLFVHIVCYKITTVGTWSQQNLIARHVAALDVPLVLLPWEGGLRNFIMQYLFHGMDLFPTSGDEVSLPVLKLLQFCSFSPYRGFMQRYFSLGHSSPSVLGNWEMKKELLALQRGWSGWKHWFKCLNPTCLLQGRILIKSFKATFLLFLTQGKWQFSQWYWCHWQEELHI